MQDIYYFNLYDIDVHFNLIAFTGQRLVVLYFMGL